MGSAFDLSPFITIVEEEVDARTPALSGMAGDTKALTPAAMARVAATSSFIFVLGARCTLRNLSQLHRVTLERELSVVALNAIQCLGGDAKTLMDYGIAQVWNTTPFHETPVYTLQFMLLLFKLVLRSILALTSLEKCSMVLQCSSTWRRSA